MSRPDDSLTLESVAEQTLPPAEAARFAQWLAYREGLGDSSEPEPEDSDDEK